MIYMEGRSLDGIVAACDRPTLRALLAAGSSPGRRSAAKLLTRGEARAGLRLVPIEQVVEPNRHGLDVTIGGRENVAANDRSSNRNCKV